MKTAVSRRLAVAVVRALTRLYPRRFRRAYGDSIVDDFQDLQQDAGHSAHGRRFVWNRVFLRTVFSVVAGALSERIHNSMIIPAPRRAGLPAHTERHEIMHGAWQDLRFAMRGLRKHPFFTVVVVMTLAIGVGMNTAIFSLVSRVLWNELPYAEPQELVSVWSSNLTRGFNRWGVSLHDYTDWRTRSDVLADVAAYNVNSINLSGTDRPHRVTYAQVTPSFFTTLQTPPQLGRIFREEENLPGRDDVLIVSHGLWQDMLGATSDVVGTSLTVDGRRMTIVGVMPPEFTFPVSTVRLWKPFGMLPEDEGGRDGRWVRAIGRLAPNTSLEVARASLDVLGASLAADYTESNDGFGIYIEPLLTTTVSGVQSSLLILWGTTGLILLIVCANVSNMMLARAMSRSQETAVRAALGASRGRLARQLVAEGLPIAFLACLSGLAVAFLCIRILPWFVEGQIPRLEEVTLDGRIVMYSLGLSLLVGLVFSLVPVVRSSGRHLASSLHHGTRVSAVGLAVRIRNGIVVVQLALAMTVVVGAGLLAKSLIAMLNADPGFSGDHVLTVRIAPSWSEMPERTQAIQLFDDVQDAVARIPGVLHVSAINALPLSGNAWSTEVELVGTTLPDASAKPSALTRVVLPGYHQTMRIPLLRGRSLTARDDNRAVNALVLNETAARAWWPDQDALGKIVRYDGVPRTVVGIVGDVSQNGPGAPITAMMYVPFAQARFGNFQNWGMTYVIQTENDPALSAETVVSRMETAARGIPLYSVRTMDDVIAASVSAQTLYTSLLSVFAAIAFAVSTIGVYSVISYVVNQRKREISVRIALGAARTSVMKLVVARALVLAAIGIIVGAIAATVVARTLDRFLFQTAPVDPLTYAVAGGMFIAAVVVASVEPALRAARADPMEALVSD